MVCVCVCVSVCITYITHTCTLQTGGSTRRVRLWQVRVDQCLFRHNVQHGTQYTPQTHQL